MSWLPGTARTGSPSSRRNPAACSCCERRPRWVRSPEAITSSGSTSSISRASASIGSDLTLRPKWRSETWRTRVRTFASVPPGGAWEPPAAAIHSVQMAETAPDSDAPEIFDDLYLGLRAGGALRKQRRGEPLTNEEREALGRWQRLSDRKS